MASVSSKALCTSCNKPFHEKSNIPHVLQCLHVFCHSCLEQMHEEEESYLKCLSCGEGWDVHPRGLRSLPIDHIVLRENQAIIEEGHAMCHNCPDRATAKFMCKECCEFQCQTCRSHHLDKRSKITMNHEVIKLKEITPEFIKSTIKSVRCKEHDHPLRFYCDKAGCEIPICVECTVFEHDKQKGHLICKLDEVFEDRKCNIEALSKRANDEYITLVRREENEKQSRSILEKQKEKALNEIQDEFEQLSKLLKERKCKLKEEVERKYAFASDEIKSKLDEIKKEQDKRLQARAFSDRAIAQCTKVEFLSIDKFFQHRFDALTQTFPRNQPIRGYKLGYNKLPRDVIDNLRATQHTVSLGTEIVASVDVITMFGIHNQRSKVAEIFLKDTDGNRLAVDVEVVKVTASRDKQEHVLCEVEVADDQNLYQVYLAGEAAKGNYLLRVEVHGQILEQTDTFVELRDEQDYEEELASEESCVQEDGKVNKRNNTKTGFIIDKSTAYKWRTVSNNGTMLTFFSGHTAFTSGQLQRYEGGIGTVSFCRMTGGKVDYVVEAQYTIKKSESSVLLFEVGLSRREDVDKECAVGNRGNTYSFQAFNCQTHNCLCWRLYVGVNEVAHSQLSSNAVGTYPCKLFGFRLDLDGRKWYIVDYRENHLMAKADINIDRALWPVFGIYNPYHYDVSLRLRTC